MTRVKRKVAMVVAMLMAMSVGALAAILITAGVTGSVQVVDKATIRWLDNGTTKIIRTLGTDGSGIACTPTLSGGKLKVDVVGAMPGSSCDIRAYAYGGTDQTPLALQDIDMGPAVEVSLLPGSETQCGSAFSPYQASADTIDMRLTVPTTATAGDFVMPGSAAMTAVPTAQYDETLCLN